MIGKFLRRLKSALKTNPVIFYYSLKTRKFCVRFLQVLLGDKKLLELRYRIAFGKKLNLKAPKTMNEKIQWLKLYDRKDLYTILVDKYAVRDWLAQRFGEQYLIPLLFTTSDWREITPANLPDIPCIIKSNGGSGSYCICRDKNAINWKWLRKNCELWLNTNYYYVSQEWPHKNLKPRLIVEKLLLNNQGKIPNDYKLQFFNGKLEFIYCSIDREGGNFRNVYSPEWKALNFSWGAHDEKRGPEINPPESFNKMVEIGSKIARLLRYVRVDFYDVDGRLYYGEVTLHHGSGYNHFTPESYDLYYGSKLDLNAPVEDEVQ